MKKQNSEALDFLRNSLREAIIAAGLDDSSILKQLSKVLNKTSDESNAAIDANTIRAVDVVLRLTNAYPAKEQRIEIDDVRVGVVEPDDVDI